MSDTWRGFLRNQIVSTRMLHEAGLIVVNDVVVKDVRSGELGGAATLEQIEAAKADGGLVVILYYSEAT